MERIISFKTNNKSWSKQLQPNDIFSSPSFIRGCFYFKGNINIERYIKSMEESFKYFELLLANLNLNERGIPFITYIANKDIELLEINERTNETINDLDIQQLLPSKAISEEQQSGCVYDLNGMKMGAFKLTVFGGGNFTIGFNISHSLFDQNCICYYFKFLSQIYTNGFCILKKPEFVDYSIFNLNQSGNNNNNKSIRFQDFNHSIKFAIDKLGFFYFPQSSNQTKINLNLFSNNTILAIEFNSKEIDKIKCSTSNDGLVLSKNDIITSILFKLFTFTSLLNENDIFYLKYLCNIRKLAKLGEESLGNLYKYSCIPLKVLTIRELSIIEIAFICRKNVNGINIDDFKEDIEWYKYTQDENHDNFGYYSQSINFTMLSNWTQFGYDQIKFDDSTPYSLKPVCAASFGTNFISFDINEANERIITTSISIPPDSISSIINLSNKSKLYKIINKK